MRSHATVYLTGWLAQDPQQRQAGQHVLTTTAVAVSAGKKGDPKAFEYFDIEAWREAGEYLGDLSKGDFVVIRGRLRQDRWESREGQKRSRVVVTVDDIAEAIRDRGKASPVAAATASADELPF